jgi:hypothetical protein
MLWRLGVAADLIVPVCAVAQTWIYYLLLRPVSKTLVLLSVFFSLVSLAVEAVSKLFLLAVVPTLGNAAYLTRIRTRAAAGPFLPRPQIA